MSGVGSAQKIGPYTFSNVVNFLVFFEQSNKVLCERFQIEEFPTLYWGSPQKLAVGGGSVNAKLGLESTTLENVNTGDKLLQWINQRIGKYA